MATRRIDPGLIYKQLEHLEKEIQIIKRELAQIAPIAKGAQAAKADSEATWEALQEAKGLWEHEWDAEWESIWEKP